MNSNKSYNGEFLSVILIFKFLCPLLIVLIIGLREIFIIPNRDNDDINSRREIVTQFNVTDSNKNGFRIIYATKNPVDEFELKAIQKDNNLKKTTELLKNEAKQYFPDMLYTDIYDFADFALKYDLHQKVNIHNIFITGEEKIKLYFNPNPKIPNSVTFYSPLTQQGLLYIYHNDIYFRCRKTNKIYRYWKCMGINAISFEDEHFSHFSEDEKLE